MDNPHLIGFFLLLSLGLAPLVCAVDIDTGVEIVTAGGGVVTFAQNSTATDVTLDADGATFANLTMVNNIVELTLNPETNLNLTVTDVHSGQVTVNASASGAGLRFNASSAARPVSTVMGGVSWAGTVVADTVVAAGVSLVTVFWSVSSGSGFWWVFVLLAGLVFMLVSRRR